MSPRDTKAALPALSSEGILHYLTALAALSAPGGAEGNVLYEQLLASAGLVGGVKGMCGKGAGVGGIKGAKGKPVPKGKGKAEKGKKSSPFEAEEVEVAATLALLRSRCCAGAGRTRCFGQCRKLLIHGQRGCCRRSCGCCRCRRGKGEGRYGCRSEKGGQARVGLSG